MYNCIRQLCSVSIAALLAAATSAHAFEPLPDKAPVPGDNPMSEAKIKLGKQLFLDPRLSVDGTISCNSCHNVMANGTDNRRTSAGVKGQRGPRNAPTVWNAAFMTAQFWDGRAATLEDQAKGPLVNPVEMGNPSHDAVAQRIASIPGYRRQFEAVFEGDDPVTIDKIAKAIAAYERTLITPDSPFDRYLEGDKDAISDAAKRGAKLVEDVGCTSCHNGPNFAGPVNLPTGKPFLQKFPTHTDNEYVEKYNLMDQLGRYEVTKKEGDKHMWKVQSWRNVAVTAPYFHNGSVDTLPEAIRVMAKTQLDEDLTEQQVNDIVAFLNSLTGKFPDQTMPRLPETPNKSVIAKPE